MQIEASSADFGQLAEHDIRRDAVHWIGLAEAGRLQENVDSFLERTFHKTTCLLPVDAVASQSHEMSVRRHDVAEQRQMTVVDICVVKRNDMVHLFLDRFSSSFDAESLEAPPRLKSSRVEFFFFIENREVKSTYLKNFDHVV